MRKCIGLLVIIIAFSVIVIGCSNQDEKEESASYFKADKENLICQAVISPNEEYVDKEEDIVYYNVEVYQNESNEIMVKASSNSQFFKGLQYILEYDKEISESDITISWATMMGNTEYTQTDQLAVANVVISENGEVLSERKINFTIGAIDIITDVLKQKDNQ